MSIPAHPFGTPNPDRRTALRRLLGGTLGGLAGIASLPDALQAGGRNAPESGHNALLWAVAWKRTAAEYRALCLQGYALARLRLDQALGRASPGDRPLAVIADLDDTVLHAADYWAELIASGQDFFDDALWDAWIPQNRITPVPGALEFLRYAEDRGVEIFYITNRDQGEETERYALEHLQVLGVPFADRAHLTVLRETSDKEPARQAVRDRFDVVLLLGDNLNDFRRVYYVADVAERMARMEEDRDRFGLDFILFPNPTDGHWVRAIFGESEPLPTDANRARLRAAALGELGP
jgi:5'-nucleotidase (lipoprotein e(P4) family)